MMNYARLISFLKSYFFALTLIMGIGIILGGCNQRDSNQGVEAGKAFLTSQIPPDLSPKYYPPAGFVFSAFNTRDLPEARYGVASPPSNPYAQVLILVEGGYPAEAYFGIMHDLLAGGYSVWLLELPGQGGAGRFSSQKDRIELSSKVTSQQVVDDFIIKVIEPSKEKPLYLMGTHDSALLALSLLRTRLKSNLMGVFAYDPFMGEPQNSGKIWHRSQIDATYFGQIAHAWQIFNPDLRLRVKSDEWMAYQTKIYKDIKQNSLATIRLDSKKEPVTHLLTNEASSIDYIKDLKSFCGNFPNCTITQIDTTASIGYEIIEIIKYNSKS